MVTSLLLLLLSVVAPAAVTGIAIVLAVPKSDPRRRVLLALVAVLSVLGVGAAVTNAELQRREGQAAIQTQLDTLTGADRFAYFAADDGTAADPSGQIPVRLRNDNSQWVPFVRVWIREVGWGGYYPDVTAGSAPIVRSLPPGTYKIDIDTRLHHYTQEWTLGVRDGRVTNSIRVYRDGKPAPVLIK